MLFLKVVMVVSKSQYEWVKNGDAPVSILLTVTDTTGNVSRRGAEGRRAQRKHFLLSQLGVLESWNYLEP